MRNMTKNDKLFIVGMSILVSIAVAYTGWIGLLIVLLPIIGIIAFYLFVSKPEWGLVILFIEIIWGGNGRWLSFMHGAFTPRYVLIVAVLLGYGIRILRMRRFMLPHLRLRLPLGIFIVVIIYGVLLAFLNSNPEPIAEPQVWLYLILYPIIVDLWKTKGLPNVLLRVLLWSIAGMAAVTLLMMLAANLAPLAFYGIRNLTPLEAMRITAPHMQGTSLIYIFWGNSSLAGLALAVSILLLNLDKKHQLLFPTWQLRLIALFSLLTMVFSMTRGTWAQLVLTMALLGIDFMVRRRIPFRTYIFLGLVSLAVVGGVLSIDFVRNAFIERIETLNPRNRDALNQSDSVIVKAIEKDYVLSAIEDRPIMGYGFGQGDYGYLGTDMVDRSRFHNWFLGFTLKTGLIGLASLLFLLGSVCCLALLVGQYVRKIFPEDRAILFGWVYGLLGIALASTTNPHMGTPAFVIALALGMAFIDLIGRKAKTINKLGLNLSAE